MKGGASIEEPRYTALHHALEKKRLDIIQLLVHNGARIDFVEMKKVFDTWNKDIIKFFIEKGASCETGRAPDFVKVMGRQIAVRVDELDVPAIRDNIDENRRWRKAMIEQAAVNTCIALMVRCGVDDVGLLWAFMPNEKGLVSEIRAGPILSSLDCASATDLQYAGYGRYLFGKAISEGFLSEATENGVMNYYYSRPAIGSGCSFYDMVDFR